MYSFTPLNLDTHQHIIYSTHGPLKLPMHTPPHSTDAYILWQCLAVSFVIYMEFIIIVIINAYVNIRTHFTNKAYMWSVFLQQMELLYSSE